MKIWDYYSGNLIKQIPKIRYGTYILKYNIIACINHTDPSEILLVSINSFKISKIFKLHFNSILRLVYDENMDILISAGFDSKIII